MSEFLTILLVVGAFVGLFWLVCFLRDRKLLRADEQEKPRDRKAA
jgi:hypothetical protein